MFSPFQGDLGQLHFAVLTSMWLVSRWGDNSKTHFPGNNLSEVDYSTDKCTGRYRKKPPHFVSHLKVLAERHHHLEPVISRSREVSTGVAGRRPKH